VQVSLLEQAKNKGYSKSSSERSPQGEKMMARYLTFDCVNVFTEMSELPNGSLNNNWRNFVGVSNSDSYSLEVAESIACGV